MKKKLKNLLFVFGILLVITIGLYAYWSWSWSAERNAGEKRLTQIRDETSRIHPGWDQVIDFYNQRLDPPEINSAVKAFAIVDALPREFHQWCNEADFLKGLEHNEMPSDEAIKELKEKLRPYDKQISELKQLIKTSPNSGFRIVVDQRNPLNTLLEERQKFRRVAQLLHFDLLIQLQTNPKSLDLEHTRAILGAARAIQDDCLLLCQLVKLATNAIAIQALERTLAQVDHPMQLDIVRKELLQAMKARSLSVAIRGERQVMDLLFERLDEKCHFTGAGRLAKHEIRSVNLCTDDVEQLSPLSAGPAYRANQDLQ